MPHWPPTRPLAASGPSERAGAGWGLHMVPQRRHHPASLLPIRARGSSCQLYVRWERSSEPGAFLGLRGAEGLGRGEQGHPSPCLADKQGPGWKEGSVLGPARSRQQSRRLGGPGFRSPAAPGPRGISAPSTAVAARLRSVWAAAGPPSPRRGGPSGLGRGVLRKHERTGSGRKPPSKELHPAREGTGDSLPRCRQPWGLG